MGHPTYGEQCWSVSLDFPWLRRANYVTAVDLRRETATITAGGGEGRGGAGIFSRGDGVESPCGIIFWTRAKAQSLVLGTLDSPR